MNMIYWVIPGGGSPERVRLNGDALGIVTVKLLEL